MADYYLSTHAAARQFGEVKLTSLCGKAATGGQNLTTEWAKVTCWSCRQVMKQRQAREVGRD